MAHVPLFIGPLIWYVCLYWVKSELFVSFEWAKERNDLIQIIGDSETIPPVDLEILNIKVISIIGSGNLSSKFARKKKDILKNQF